MQIGELAALTATQVVTIRFYEKEGLLPAPARNNGNFRIYDESHAARLAFIRRCRTLDMDLDEIRSLLHFRDEPQDNCGNVNALLDQHIDHVATRIEELRKLEVELRELRARCSQSDGGANCGIIEGLSQSTANAVKPAAGHLGPVHVRRTKARRR